MKNLKAIVLVLAFSSKVEANTFCNTYGNHTYCDDGSSYHRYGNNIIEMEHSKPKNRYHKFGDTTYGNKREWMKRSKDGNYTSFGLKGKTRQVLPDIEDEDREGDDSWGSED